MLSLHRCKVCGARWLLWPDAIHGGGWNLLDKYQRPGSCCDNAAMGDQIEHLRDFDLSALRACADAREARRPDLQEAIQQFLAAAESYRLHTALPTYVDIQIEVRMIDARERLRAAAAALDAAPREEKQGNRLPVIAAQLRELARYGSDCGGIDSDLTLGEIVRDLNELADTLAADGGAVSRPQDNTGNAKSE